MFKKSNIAYYNFFGISFIKKQTKDQYIKKSDEILGNYIKKRTVAEYL